jgi:hypothetical protein
MEVDWLSLRSFSNSAAVPTSNQRGNKHNEHERIFIVTVEQPSAADYDADNNGTFTSAEGHAAL